VKDFKEVRSILLIDDDEDDYDLVMEAIQELNPDISVAFLSNCAQVGRYKNVHFDLVLLDINMPLFDGFHWLKSIREHGYKDLPVIMYTNSLSPAHIKKAYEEGANLYFTKPDNFPKLKKGMEQIIGMDWTDPESITRRYRNEYATLSV